MTKKASVTVHPLRRCRWCKGKFKAEVKRVVNGVQIRNEYCSGSCAAFARHGKKAPRWKGGKRPRKDGYVEIFLKPDKRGESGRKYQLEHIQKMEQKLGRKLTKNEVVHHKNGIKSDNNLRNLELKTQQKHTTDHKKGQVISSEWATKISKGLKRAHTRKGKDYWQVRPGRKRVEVNT